MMAAGKQLTVLLLPDRPSFFVLFAFFAANFGFRLHRCSTRFALALPALPATLCPKEHRPRMARTKSNGNASEKCSANLCDTLLPKLLNGEVNAISADNFQNSK